VNVAVERLPASQVLLDITTDEQEFEKALDRAYRKVVGQVRLPGFRPGKAPRRIVEQLLGREVLIEQADRDLLEPLYQRALEQEQITPIGEPDVEVYQAEPLAFKVTVPVYPTVELGDYTGVRVEPRQVEVGDERVAEVLERLREQHSPWEEPAAPRPAREGDQVTVDVAVKQGEEDYREPLEDGVFVLGKDTLFPQLRETLVGMTPGEERQVRISFAEDDEQAEADMRGKTLDYRVALKGVKEQRPLPLDDDFARKASDGKVEMLDALRDRVREDLLAAERQRARNEVGGEVVNALGALATVELPEVMVAKQLDTEIEQLRERLQGQGQTLEGQLRLEGKTLEGLREELAPEAARRLRNSLVLREIAAREGISVSAADVDAEIERLVALAEDPEQMRPLYSSRYVKNMLETDLFDRKLLDRAIAIATAGRGPFTPPAEDGEAG
jgi:trigger factor